MENHRACYTRWNAGLCNNITVNNIFQEYGVENSTIVLIEAYPCTSKDELTSREACYIKSTDCVNKIIPGRTPKEYRDQLPKDMVQTKHKQYYEANKEKIKEQASEYYQANAEKKKAYWKSDDNSH